MEELAPLRIKRPLLSSEEESEGPVDFRRAVTLPPLRTHSMASGRAIEASNAWGEKEARMRLELRVRSQPFGRCIANLRRHPARRAVYISTISEADLRCRVPGVLDPHTTLKQRTLGGESEA